VHTHLLFQAVENRESVLTINFVGEKSCCTKSRRALRSKKYNNSKSYIDTTESRFVDGDSRSGLEAVVDHASG